ncbi:uncharacterized protein MYCFIDRAFT_172594 [Pseudocercospora fijiensis CIRAD86]|uniref:Uncharacterized protein n=1 Tax=Pseudocercospora fijiensis (strain CIRAD86) TaxID=383855 RepID=M2ZAP9_PSEFD|nr:uncharacterized protein MYCFIDRAFT_172594 [Pseudocercospora fijiensis CIRAD86]EME86900.1 hypothetical protein MYCFIDRAFT_172594 [Pseudocercospora fijiensis CIRAD86]
MSKCRFIPPFHSLGTDDCGLTSAQSPFQAVISSRLHGDAVAIHIPIAKRRTGPYPLVHYDSPSPHQSSQNQIRSGAAESMNGCLFPSLSGRRGHVVSWTLIVKEETARQTSIEVFPTCRTLPPAV